ncbi:hypothetical protein SKAU_G00004230 [Synaphobranchus kaupii]|uniref:Uncharacterized protein n=1 Tax=Synaphobranchus kaupii TaxID=118154 RepID=A0A9Q1G9S7_SYNKA|nr:hypothetical protein SKAU_G00004230 [Synaphobranchus kaupii]
MAKDWPDKSGVFILCDRNGVCPASGWGWGVPPARPRTGARRRNVCFSSPSAFRSRPRRGWHLRGKCRVPEAVYPELILARGSHIPPPHGNVGTALCLSRKQAPFSL